MLASPGTGALRPAAAAAAAAGCGGGARRARPRPPRAEAAPGASTATSSKAKGAGAPAAPAAPAAPKAAAPPAADAAKLAAAAKISAARSLARKLADEKQAAAAAARLAAEPGGGMAPGAAAEMVRSVELEVAGAAAAAARADAAARAAAAGGGKAPTAELERLKRENEALQELLLQLARDRGEAEARVSELRVPKAAAVPAAPAAPAAAAAAAAAAAPPAPPASAAKLAELAAAAAAAGERAFSSPAPAPVGAPARVFYDAARGPLPRGGAGFAPVLKAGLNKWEAIVQVPMQRAPDLPGGEWWAADLALPALLFRAEFVVLDSASGAVDNNGSKDFALALAGAPTEEEVLARRLALLAAWEAERAAEAEAAEAAAAAARLAAAEGEAAEARAAAVAARAARLAAEADAVVAERRGEAAAALQRYAASPAAAAGRLRWAGDPPAAGKAATLCYDRAGGPLAGAGDVVAQVGYDGWWMQDVRVVPLAPLGAAAAKKAGLPPGDWVAGEVPVWNSAAVVDAVFCDAARRVWDNNGGADFHCAVAGAPSGDTLAGLVRAALDAASAADGAREADAAAERVRARAAAKAAALRRRREGQARFLFTRPLAPRAGAPVEVFYDPGATLLRGRPEVYVRGGFNRGASAACFTPARMEPAVPEAGGLGFLRAVVDVPADAHTLDLVFMDSRDTHGGFADDNRGLEYHVPVEGGAVPERKLRVVHVASEMAPIAKAGGLGDVVTALGRAVAEEGHDVEVVLPKYDVINYKLVTGLAQAKDFFVGDTQVKVWHGLVEGLPTTFLEPLNGLFWAGAIYTDMNRDRGRFGAFCDYALAYLKHHAGAPADVVHCHDWQSAPMAWLDRGGAAAVFTIHNLNFGADLVGGAVNAAEAATTVSPTYATEIAGHPAVAAHGAKFHGVRNGIDVEIWDPAADDALPVPYSCALGNAAEGKAAAKAALRARLQLADGDVPLVGCVTRLTHQKGIHLIKHAAWRALERGAQFVLLGSAPEAPIQAEFDALAADLGRQYPDRARLCFAYDEPLSHLIYAGSDLFLVPSVFEPCGLTQMIAMRYGAVPVVRRTGGLADTVMDVDDDVDKAAAMGLEPNGFSFDSNDAGGMDYALNRALSLYFSDRGAWSALVARAMGQDWSWASPALSYIDLYHFAIARHKMK